MKNRILLSVITVCLAGSMVTAGDWTQFGGPRQDFKADSKGLSATWPESGPAELWSRELGDGYSGILFEAGKLYTMFGTGEEEAIVALDAKTGKTLWERRYAATPSEGHVSRFGSGPRATPVIDGDKIYAVGVAGRMHCLEKKGGAVVWSKDLWGGELDGTVLMHGYSSSPLIHGNQVIVLVGGEGNSIVAFDKRSGKLKWKAHDFANSYSTPVLLDVDGQTQVVALMDTEIIAVDPKDGSLEWSWPHDGANVNMPVMADKNHLFLSAPQAGARGLKLTRRDGKTEVEEIWTTRKIQFYHVTSVREGDWVYGSTGTGTPSFMAAINIRTGEIGWRKRGFAKANVLGADGKLIILDEAGKLYLTTATPDELQIHAETEVFDDVSWTVPTIIGKTLYLRDTKRIVALDLG